MTKSDAEKVVSIFIDTLRHTMIDWDERHIKGFGKFVQTYKPARTRNIFGTTRKFSEKRGVKFYPFKGLIDAMNSQ